MKFLESYSFEVVASFIANLNSNYETRVEYLDDNIESIYNDIKNLFFEPKNHAKIFVAEDSGLLKGVFIFDIEDKSADVWGPFILESDLELAQELWQYSLNHLKSDVKNFKFAINHKNNFSLSFVKKLGAEFYDDNAVFIHKKENYSHQNTYKVTELHPDLYEEVKNLHKDYFPNYYLNYDVKIDSLEKQKIFVIKDKCCSVSGYVHIIYTPKINDALINYLAVKKQDRRRGYAKELIQAALNEFYQYDSISECYLRIDLDNFGAEKFYKNIGFNKIFETKIYRYQQR